MKEYKSIEQLSVISTFTVLMIALVHSGYFLMFYFFDVAPGAYFKAAEAIFAWFVCLNLFWLKKFHNLMIYYVRTSVLFSCSVCHILLGPAYGFASILLLMIAIGYIHNFRSSRAPTLFGLIEVFIVICICGVGYFSPNYPSDYANAVHFVGLVVMAGMVIFYAQFSGLVLLADDIKISERQESIKSDAESDRLSGLYNRATMCEVLNSQIAIFNAHNNMHNKLCVALLDMDKFRTINQTFGHKFGDLVVFNSAEYIKSFCQEVSDTNITVYASRWSGQEFLISAIMPDAQIFCDLIEKIIQKSLTLAHSDGYHSGRATLSAGVVICERALSLDALLHKAGTALYNAKYAGGAQSNVARLLKEK